MPVAFVPASCETGVFRKDGSNFVAINRNGKGYGYSFSDGTVGNANDTSNAGAVIECGAGVVRVRGQESWGKVAVSETNTLFASDGVMLAGRLMAPPGADRRTPLVVFAHGSEESGWIDHVRDPYQMVGRGIAVFVYDKRGTGLSKGVYTQNLPQLSNDLVAASQEAKRLAQGRYGRFGLFGLSQGGWVAPLAALRAKAEFVGIGYGLAVDIAEQDAAQVSLDLRERGFGEDVVAKGRLLSDITARLVKSGYRDGLDDLAAAQAQFGKEPWFSRIKGGYTGVLLGMSVDQLRDQGIPQLDKLGVDWSLKPMQTLGEIDVPQLWAFGAEDRAAPIALTLERLSALRKQGKDISIYIFPDTEHGMWNYTQAADLSRKRTRIAPGFYDLLADWARGGVEGNYGRAYRR